MYIYIYIYIYVYIYIYIYLCIYIGLQRKFQGINMEKLMVAQSARIACFRGNSILFPSSGGSKFFKHNMIANTCCST